MTERSWISEPEEYVCRLSKETQEIAERELREDNNSRRQALESFRQWIKQNPKIVNCRLGMNRKLRNKRRMLNCLHYFRFLFSIKILKIQEIQRT